MKLMLVNDDGEVVARWNVVASQAEKGLPKEWVERWNLNAHDLSKPAARADLILDIAESIRKYESKEES